MKCTYACDSPQHEMSRRAFLQGVTAGGLSVAGFGGMVHAEASKQLASQQKQVVVFWFSGGVSQLETWDPKPGTDTGGPTLAIPTSVPGIHIANLLPYTAQQMHHLALVRGVNTKENGHGKGAYFMQTGQRQTPAFNYPYLGSCFSKQLSPPGSELPGYIHVGGGGGAREAAFLGPKHAPLGLSDGKAPKNLARFDQLSEVADKKRRGLRKLISGNFAKGRRTAQAEAYNASYDEAAKLMARRDIFDLSKVSAKDQERYGSHPFGRRCLLARQLVEAGVTFTKVTHSNYDSHSENFTFHVEQLEEWDRPFASFIEDLSDRGLLEHTLVICMCEFGRTPRINQRLGRDHWGTAWSVVVAGAGIKRGTVNGATNANGTKVIKGEVDGGHLFHTYYQAVGLDATQKFISNGRPVPKAPDTAFPIKEILA